MKTRRTILKNLSAAAAALVAASVLPGCSRSQSGEGMPKLRIAASIYVGWMPWMLAAESGLLAEQGKQRGLDISLLRGDYAETIDQYLSGHCDAIVITNIDALGAFAESKIASDVILIGSFSAGNDALLLPAGQTGLAQGGEVGLVKNSVSEYVLDRYLETQQRALNTVKIIDVSDADMASTFVAAGNALAGVVTWNPIVAAIEANAGGKRLYDSKSLPGEIADSLVVRRSVLEAYPEFAQALLATWFGVMQKMQGAEKAETLSKLAALSGSSVAEYQSQLDSTDLMSDKTKALAALANKNLPKVMERVANFVESRGLAKTDRPSWVSFGAGSAGTLRFNSAALERLS